MTPSKDRNPSRSQISEIGGISDNISTRNVGALTPTKEPLPSRSHIAGNNRVSENNNPNISDQSPLQKSGNSQAAKSKKSASKAPIRIGSFQNAIQERKFVVAKKSSKRMNAAAAVVCKCKEKPASSKKCPCVAYEALRASQEEFFRARIDDDGGDLKGLDGDEKSRNGEGEKDPEVEDAEKGFRCLPNESETLDAEEIGLSDEAGSSKMKKIRNRLLEEARNSIPESGRVMHLVKAFESILSIPNSSGSKGKEDDVIEESKNKVMKWALPGFHGNIPEAEVSSSSSLSSTNLSLLPKNFDLVSRVDSSFISSNGSAGSSNSDRGRRSQRNSSDSSGRGGGRKWEKKLKVTSQHPFKLRTEQRGRFKKEEFHKKVEGMLIEEKQLRIPIAQGLPWTTDEPELDHLNSFNIDGLDCLMGKCLVKPPVKESTKPIDLILHSDIRAVERAEFDHQVADKISLMEQLRLERERQQKMEEEEKIRMLRKELVPKAQPMPYFDRPFIPKRSLKNPTIPKEPKFHIPQHKKIKCMSWNDINFSISTDDLRNGRER